jgi:hypothetical protein
LTILNVGSDYLHHPLGGPTIGEVLETKGPFLSVTCTTHITPLREQEQTLMVISAVLRIHNHSSVQSSVNLAC